MDIGVIVTRPAHQAEELHQLITTAGGIVYRFPTIAIAPPENFSAVEAAIKKLADYNIAIFVSANAVWQTATSIKKHWPTLPGWLRIAAMGAGTQKALLDTGLPVHILSKSVFNTENLLEEPELQWVSHQKILIFTGENGRDLLAKKLADRGANIDKAICYRRIIPLKYNAKTVLAALNQQQIQAMICTSNESLSNLFAMLGGKAQTTLKNLQLIGVSNRIIPLAEKLDLIHPPLIAAQASNQAIKNILIEWWKNTMTKEKRESSTDKKTAKITSETAAIPPTAESEKESAKTKNIASPKKLKDQYGSPSWQSILATFAIVLSLIAILETAYFWTRFRPLENLETMIKQQIAQNESRQPLLANLQTQIQQLNDLTKQHATQILENQTALQNLAATKEQTNKAWVLSEVRYLLRLAQLNLHFNHNIPAAIAMLNTANKNLRDLADPNTLDLQQSITDAIAQLESLPKVDLTYTLAQLNALSMQIANLPLAADKISAPLPTQSSANQPVNGWKRYWQQSLDTLEKLIIIRRKETPGTPLISPQQQANLITNIQAKFSQASWALLNNNNAVFQESLKDAIAWIQQYYEDSPATQNILKTLTQLQKINLNPKYPNLSGSLDNVNRLLGQRP